MSGGPCWARHPQAPPDVATSGGASSSPPDEPASPQSEACDRCGSSDTWWRNCKLLCRQCGGIVKSCADL